MRLCYVECDKRYLVQDSEELSFSHPYNNCDRMIGKEDIEQKIHEIFLACRKQPYLPPGLFSGQAGLCLFLYMYYKHTKEEEAFSAFQDSLTEMIEGIYSFDNLFFANGVSGAAWLLDFLYREEAVSSDVLEMVDGLDGFIESHLDVHQEVSDFMHGSLGSAFYFTQREKVDVVQKIFSILFEDSQEGDDLYWISKIYDEDHSSSDVVNLSLAHGSAAIISIISKFLSRQTTADHPELQDRLTRVINFLKHTKSKGPANVYPGHCFFNEKGELENAYARLSWCYGEMGIGQAFWQAGTSLAESSYQEEAIDIYRNTLQRKTLEDAGINDAGLCHGTAGLVHMYNRMYYNTGLAEFREAADNWVEQTLKVATFDDGLAGYKTWYQPNWVPEYSLLGGVSGVGLSLLSHLNQDCAAWDECLLLS